MDINRIAGKIARELVSLRLMGRLEGALKGFDFEESRGRLYSPTYDLSTYNKVRKQVAKALKKAGYEQVGKEYWEYPDGEKIRIIGMPMRRGWSFSIETA